MKTITLALAFLLFATPAFAEYSEREQNGFARMVEADVFFQNFEQIGDYLEMSERDLKVKIEAFVILHNASQEQEREQQQSRADKAEAGKIR